MWAEQIIERDPSATFACGCYAIILLFALLIWCNISRRLGYSWALGILGVIPIANLIIMCVFAFAESPNERRLREMENDLRRLEQDLDRSERRRQDIEDELDALESRRRPPSRPEDSPRPPPDDSIQPEDRNV